MPAFHALIVGVSEYPYLPGGTGQLGPRDFGMGQLSAAASSAARVADWLQSAARRLPVPLGIIRLLLSPTPEEIASRPSLATAGLPATRDSLIREALAWREDCTTDRENIALFFFAGHGVQRSRADAVLLTSDFAEAGGNPLLNAVDVNNLFGGMAPSVKRQQMAETQLWFIDACRGFPEEFDDFERLAATEVFEVVRPDVDKRCAPIYFGALPGTSARSIIGDATIFSKALLRCLNGGAGCRLPGSTQWIVTVGSLLRGLQLMVGELNAKEGADQEVFDGGQTPRQDTPIVALEGVPDVEVRIELHPPAAASRVALSVQRSDGTSVSVPSPLDPNPFPDRWPAGVYRVAAAPPECGIVSDLWPVMPPVFPWRGEVRA